MRLFSLVAVAAVVVAVLVNAGCASGGAVKESAPSPVSPETQAAAATESAPPVNTLRWSTASEVENFGFDIYRATSEDGPFERVTPRVIPGAGTTDEPQSYVWVDDTIDPTRGYYYYIESISDDGERQKFSPVISVGPKRPVRD